VDAEKPTITENDRNFIMLSYGMCFYGIDVRPILDIQEIFRPAQRRWRTSLPTRSDAIRDDSKKPKLACAAQG
jgi:hypothetical protein